MTWAHDIKTDDDAVFQEEDWIGSVHDEDPPDSNLGPATDYKIDEDMIWDFTRNSLTTRVNLNEWTSPTEDTYRKSFIPWWHDKLFTPDYYRESSWRNMEFQWKIRVGLEKTKKLFNYFGDHRSWTKQTNKLFQKTLSDYVGVSEGLWLQRKTSDVNVTEHK